VAVDGKRVPVTATETEHEHAFPANPPGGTYLKPGACECGKTFDQARADEKLQQAIALTTAAYGVPPRVSTHWAVAWGSESLNDGIGFVEQWDDEEDARGHARYYEGGRVVKRTVIALRWEAAPPEAPAEAWPADGSAGICPGCGNPVFYQGEPGSYGAWFHESGMEDCDE
jgi:hypothetical protein